MKIQSGNQAIHLTYCLNIHPGETWAAHLDAIRTHACAVRDAVAPGRPFGLGLRLGAAAALELLDEGTREAFRAFLRDRDLYVFTVNGFPYGAFHGGIVKERVYAPDWYTEERVEYTRNLGAILADLLPEGVVGSISTVPGTYRAWTGSGGQGGMITRLMQVVAEFADLERRTGRRIVLALEPEPDCVWDCADTILPLFAEEIPRLGMPHLCDLRGCASRAAAGLIRRHLGVCLDTCHHAVLFEEPAAVIRRYVAAGVTIAKLQISAAPRVPCSPAAVGTMRAFVDPCYLHQTAIRTEGGRIRRFPDLEPALAAAAELDFRGELRTHFHIPLIVDRWKEVVSTRGLLDAAFWALVRGGVTEHIETETYTFDVLPGALRREGVAAVVARELEWTAGNLRSAE